MSEYLLIKNINAEPALSLRLHWPPVPKADLGVEVFNASGFGLACLQAMSVFHFYVVSQPINMARLTSGPAPGSQMVELHDKAF